jgi:hypothetical protein
VQYEQSASHGPRFREHRSEVILQSLDHLLSMARRYRSEGQMRQAMGIYWMLSEDHAGTAQAQGAQDSLLELADLYERDGFRHQARAIYQRLCDSHVRGQKE